MKCQTSAHLTGQLELVAWLKDDRILLTNQQQTGQRESSISRRIVRFNAQATIENQIDSNNIQKYLILPFGHLHIRNVSKSDSGNYKCRMRNRLTGLVKTSEIAGRLMVDERPQLTAGTSLEDPSDPPTSFSVYAREQTEFVFCLQVHSFPMPKFSWFKESASGSSLQTSIKVSPASDSGDVRPLEECIVIPKVQPKHAGIYHCQLMPLNQSIGAASHARRHSIQLIVGPAQLSVQLNLQTSPQQSLDSSPHSLARQHIVQLGSNVRLNCSISGSPYDTIAWFKDSKLLAAVPADSQGTNQQIGEQLRLVQSTVINIDNFEIRNAGIYQCQAYTAQLYPNLTISHTIHNQKGHFDSQASKVLFERDHFRSASGSIQIDIQLVKPILIQKFPTQVSSNQGDFVSIQCGAVGLPAPKIVWFIDGQLISVASSLPTASSSGSLKLRSLSLALEESGPADDLIGHNLYLSDTPRDGVPNGKIDNDGDNFVADGRFEISSQTVVSASNHHLPLTLSQLNISRLEASESGQYKCLAFNSLGSSWHQGQLNVWSEQLQLRHYQPLNRTLIAGKTATLQCPLVGYPLQRIEWFFAGQRLPYNHRQRLEPIKNGIGGQLELSNVDRNTDSGIYSCKASLDRNESRADELDSGDSMEGQIHVRVRVAPVIDAQSMPELIQADEGKRVKLVCSIIEGDHPVEIRWLKRVGDRRRWTQMDGFPLNTGYEYVSGSQSNSGNKQTSQSLSNNEDPISIHNIEDSSLLTFKRISYANSGDYLCLAENEVSRTARNVRIVVNVVPSWSHEPPSELNALLGSRLQLDCSANGFPSPQVSWRRESIQVGGRNSSGTTNSIDMTKETSQAASKFIDLVSNFRQRSFTNGSLVIESVDLTDSGVFMCEVSNGVGTGLSKLVQVSVNVPPHFKQKSVTQLAQLNGKVELRCQVFGDQPVIMGWRQREQVVDLVNDPRHRSVSERRLGSQTSESIISIDNLQRNDSDQYTCVASNEFGTEEMSFNLIVQEPPEAPLLMRPIRASSRQATLSFSPPYSGNTQIRRYAIGYRQVDLIAQSTMTLSPATESLGQLGWQQTIVEADDNASASKGSQAIAKSPTLSQPDSDLQVELPSTQVVNLNLCCLQPFAHYIVRVKAINDIGSSDWSKAIPFQTDEETIGGPPLDVAVEPTGAHSLKVRWRSPARHLQNGLIRGYYIGYRAQNGFSHQSSALSSMIQNPQETPNVKLLEPNEGEQYQYKNVQLDLNLTPSLQRSHNLNSFDLETIGSNNQSRSQDQIYLSYLTNLKRKTAYSVIVQAYSKIGAGPRSDQIIVSTLDAAPPMSPVMRIASVSYNSAQITWSSRRFGGGILVGRASGNNHSAQDMMLLMQQESELLEDDDDPQSFYTINFRSDDSTSESTSVAGHDDWQQRRISRHSPMVPFTLTNLLCGSRYLAFMSATNSLGQSEPGNTVKFSTLGSAPIAPKQSQDFLVLNSSFVVMRLSAWRNGGCLISSFIFRYKSSQQPKWTIVEHQVHPTIQTVTVAGVAVFSTRTSANDMESKGANQMRKTPDIQPQAEPMTGVRAQSLSDFIIRNLLPDSPYRLVVEANSDAGITKAEYELDLNNLTSSTIGVQVNGLTASELDDPNSESMFGQAAQSPDLTSGRSGSHRTIPGSKNSFANLWSLTSVIVFGSVVLGSITLLLGLRSILRPLTSHSNKQNQQTGTTRDEAGPLALLGAAFCCSSRSRSSSSNSSSSHSSIGASTCYQIAADSGQPLEAYCSLGGHRNDGKLDSMMGDSMFGQPSSLVSSTSLSALGAAARLQGSQMERHHRTLAHCHGHRATERQINCDSPLDLRQARANYAATIGKQHLSSYPTFATNQQRPMKFNQDSSVISPIYARFNGLNENSDTVNLTGPFELSASEGILHYQMLPNQVASSSIYPMSSNVSSQATSGYETGGGGGNSLKLDSERQFEHQIHGQNQLEVADQIANISALLTESLAEGNSAHQPMYQQNCQPGSKLNYKPTICNSNDAYSLQSLAAIEQLRSSQQQSQTYGLIYQDEQGNQVN